MLRGLNVVPLFYGRYEDAKAGEDRWSGGKRWLVMEDCGTPADLSDPEVQYV